MPVGETIGQFFRLCLGGAAGGYLVAWLACLALSHLRPDLHTEATITFLSAYGMYVLVQSTPIQVSGLIALVFGGVYLSHHGLRLGRLSPSSLKPLQDIWAYAGFLANTVIFVVCGLIMGAQAFTSSVVRGQDWGHLIALYLWLNAVRFVTVLLFFPALRRPPHGLDVPQALMVRTASRTSLVLLALPLSLLRHTIPHGPTLTIKHLAIPLSSLRHTAPHGPTLTIKHHTLTPNRPCSPWQLSHSGLRGAVSLAMALVVHPTPSAYLSTETRDRMLFLVAGMILLTLVINASSAKALLGALGLDGQSSSTKTASPRLIQASVRVEAEATALADCRQFVRRHPWLSNISHTTRWDLVWRCIPVLTSEQVGSRRLAEVGVGAGRQGWGLYLDWCRGPRAEVSLSYRYCWT